MKILTFLNVFLFASGVSAQMLDTKDFAIYNTYSNPISKEEVKGAKTLADIKDGYPSSWVTDYVSTEVSIIFNGDTFIASGSTELLTSAQKELIQKAEIGDDISVEVKYNILNSVTNQKTTRTMNFKSSIIPDYEAEYVGGIEMLNKYIKDHIILPSGFEEDVILPALMANFTIDAKGLVSDVKLETPSMNERVNILVIEALKKMPNWKPAGLDNGKTIAQKFRFTLGNAGC